MKTVKAFAVQIIVGIVVFRLIGAALRFAFGL